MSSLDEAFAKAPREVFLPAEERAYAGWDVPLVIGHDQTNSQPTTVRMMLEWLDVQPDQKVLDVGSGSGWTSALLAHLVGHNGRVTAVEKVPELVAFGQENVTKLGLKNVSFYEAKPDVFGWPDQAPYDRILVSAAARELPPELIEQLASGGRLVIPVQSAVVVINKAADGTLQKEAYEGFSFVPLVN